MIKLIFSYEHPATSYGMLQMASAYLPITDNWDKCIRKCDDSCAKLDNALAKRLYEYALQLANELQVNER